MEIKNYTNAINAYRYSTDCTSSGVKKEKSVKARANTDKADFSAASRSAFADTLKAAAKNAAEASSSPERLAALSAKISEGSYNVSAEDVASSILGY